ncbi:hypothetical protein JZU46_00155 [bacterium]|nr:hypothetical protein [bacterium]
MELKEMQKLFAKTADITSEEGLAAYKEFAAALTTPILQKIELESIMRQLFSVERLAPGAQAVYPIAEDFEIPVWVLPGLGYAAQNFIEGIGEEVYVPTFTINSSADWKITYARDSRIDIAQRAAFRVAKDLANYEEECGWRVIVPAATSAFSGKGLLGARPAPIYEVPAAATTGAGYLSKELVNKMMVGFKRIGRTLTDLYVSPEDAADIREWTETDIDPITRREVFQAAGMGSIWNVSLHEVQHLGAPGMYNINGSTSEYGKFLATAGSYNAYTLDHANVTNADGTIATLGETQIYGFDMTSNDSLVMPVRKEFEAYEDPTLLRVQKQGFFGWAELGFACLDSRMLGLGVIDRTV